SMRIAPTKAGLACFPRELGRQRVGGCEHMAIADFEHREDRFEPSPVALMPSTGQSGKRVIERKEDLLLAEIRSKPRNIIAALLNFHMMAFRDVVNTNVNLRARG